MRYTTAIAIGFSAAATLVAAQTSSTACEAQNIVDVCVQGYQNRIADCQRGGNDFICLCDVYRDVLTCYNNCPDSNDKPPVQSQVTAYCVAADPLRSASMSLRASIESVAATATTGRPASTAASTTAAEGSNTAGSSTSPTASSFNTNAATAFGAPAGAALVAFLGALGLL